MSLLSACSYSSGGDVHPYTKNSGATWAQGGVLNGGFGSAYCAGASWYYMNNPPIEPSTRFFWWMEDFKVTLLDEDSEWMVWMMGTGRGTDTYFVVGLTESGGGDALLEVWEVTQPGAVPPATPTFNSLGTGATTISNATTYRIAFRIDTDGVTGTYTLEVWIDTGGGTWVQQFTPHLTSANVNAPDEQVSHWHYEKTAGKSAYALEMRHTNDIFCDEVAEF